MRLVISFLVAAVARVNCMREDCHAHNPGGMARNDLVLHRRHACTRQHQIRKYPGVATNTSDTYDVHSIVKRNLSGIRKLALVERNASTGISGPPWLAKQGMKDNQYHSSGVGGPSGTEWIIWILLGGAVGCFCIWFFFYWLDSSRRRRREQFREEIEERKAFNDAMEREQAKFQQRMGLNFGGTGMLQPGPIAMAGSSGLVQQGSPSMMQQPMMTQQQPMMVPHQPMMMQPGMQTGMMQQPDMQQPSVQPGPRFYGS